MKVLFKVPYYAFIACVAALGLLLLATLVPLGGGVKVKIVKSGSMEPSIRTGGIVVIRPSSVYGVGDVITFGADTKTQIPTTHRIVEVKDTGEFVTRGDANDAPDPTAVKPFEVSGKVVFSAPYVGYILDFAKKPLGFFLLIGVPALLVIFDELTKIWAEVKRLRQNKRERVGEKPRESRILPVDGIRRRVVEIKPSSKFAGMPSATAAIRAVAIVAATLVPILGLSSAGNTVSYFRDSETSFGSMLQASADYGPGFLRTSELEISSLTLDVPPTEEIVSDGGDEGVKEEKEDKPEDKPKEESKGESEDKPKEDKPEEEVKEESENAAPEESIEETSPAEDVEEVVEVVEEPAPEPEQTPEPPPAESAPAEDSSQSSGE